MFDSLNVPCLLALLMSLHCTAVRPSVCAYDVYICICVFQGVSRYSVTGRNAIRGLSLFGMEQASKLLYALLKTL